MQFALYSTCTLISLKNFMNTTVVATDELRHFIHDHPLKFVHLQQLNHNNENVDNKDEDKYVDQCNMCGEEIWSSELYYYECRSCYFSLHKSCADLPKTLQNHPLHPDHDLSLEFYHDYEFECSACNHVRKNYFYSCSVCDYRMDIFCVTMLKQKIINHPSHPHQLERMSQPIVYDCLACGNTHKGVFFKCTICPDFQINLNCALLPVKILIQNHIDGTFITHLHPLTLAYSFSNFEPMAKFNPRCRVCHEQFKSHLWIYKCDKCQYHVHVDCATLKREPSMYIAIATDQLHHFSHAHPLSLVLLQPNHKYEKENNEDEEEDEEEEEEDGVHIVVENHHGGQCNMCQEQICSFHVCYYYCKSCDYSLHKFCAELPITLQNHPLHPGHDFSFHSWDNYQFKCFVCNHNRKNYHYYCLVCDYRMDMICASASEHKINHPSHTHQLERILFGPIVSNCVACGNKHEGAFFQCTICPSFWINLDCALLPAKLLIQNRTDGTFTHPHPLTIAYSFLFPEQIAKFHPHCRVCDKKFYSHLWIYKCDKCRYYVHVDCATSKREPFMSIFITAGLGKTYKNFSDDEHRNLLHCPFQDEGDNLLKHHMCNQKDLVIGKQNDSEIINHSSHQHSLFLFDKQTLVDKKIVSLHDPVKRIQLLCDGCVKPIMKVPFYMCCQYVYKQCCFVLHEWCAKLPSEVQQYPDHPKHTLNLLPKVPGKLFGVFECAICWLPSNGFAYGCTTCEYYVDINCAFIPEEITHEAHPNHLMSKVKLSTERRCKACHFFMEDVWVFCCPPCEFYIHVECALFLPRVIKHKCDKHPLSLRYEPVENHISEYFCEICEDEFDPWEWFYHCTTCAQSMHAACVPLILQCEQATYADDVTFLYAFLNIKFGGELEIKGHSHRLAFVQGIESDGKCIMCHKVVQYKMIFKCLECECAYHFDCV